ncbi:ankyrin repeat domain-containing protein 50-like [Trichogramma pretiosum]|uniref:ankyrin repeat domain-containing protein 50-like n=1 Tax=Trichogramma pretiosum TaxID=7493 RepID=UPI000C71A28C|nr:ankyrin repeat domain-containing protein 50-like [Trichogramma pretiosum]
MRCTLCPIAGATTSTRSRQRMIAFEHELPNRHLGMACLSRACRLGQTEVAKFLLRDSGLFDLNLYTREDGARLVRLAAAAGDLEIVRALVARWHGVDVVDYGRDEDEGRTALMYAAENGDRTMLDYFLARGAAIDAVDKAGRTALAIAARHWKNKKCAKVRRFLFLSRSALVA